MANGAAVAAGTAGVILLYSAISGNSILATVKDVVQGKKLHPIPNSTSGIAGTTVAGNGSGSGSASAIASDALRYTGHGYVYGGPSNPNQGWDCSSFVSYVLGHDLGMRIPGGTWSQVTNNGASHGPVAMQYLLWSGARNIPRANVRSGDLLCWETHVGFAVNSAEMVSALDSVQGTLVTQIADTGPMGEVLVCRRINGIS